MISEETANQVLMQVSEIPGQGASLRRGAMELLSQLPGYNWSGIYRLEGDTLVLDEYVGAATDHTHIKVGVGVCGTAVAQNANQVIDDVRSLDNYLSCSLETRSEIVVLIHSAGQILGQIDIDGHEVGAFDNSDERFLERVATILADKWE